LPYDVILRRIGRKTCPDELSQLVVDAYVTQFDDLPGGDRLAMTVLNLPAAERLKQPLDDLAREIDTAIGLSKSASETMEPLRDLFMGAAAGDVRPLIDLTTLLRGLAEGEMPFSERIAPIANELLELLHGDSLTVGQDQTDTEDSRKLVRRHRAHPDISADLHGIGIYAPFVTDDGIIKRLGLSDKSEGDGRREALNGRQQYERLDLFHFRNEKAAWPRLVFDGLRRTIPADLIFAIDGVSELQTGDRADVAQIIMSIEASFNQFDRAVKRARDGVAVTLVYPLMSLGHGERERRESPVPSFSAQWLRLIGNVTVEALQQAKNLATPPSGRVRITAGPGGPVPSFSAPWLRLIGPVPLEALQRATERKKLVAPPEGQAQDRSAASASASDLASTVSAIVPHLTRVENALSHVERVTRRGITHARFGLGLLSPMPGGFGLEPLKPGGGLEPLKPGGGLEPLKPGGGLEPLKPGGGLEPLKPGGGLEPLKPGGGLEPLKPGGGLPGGLPGGLMTGDLSVDLALIRVAELFSEVGSALEIVERATLNVELIARDLLVVSPDPAAGSVEARAAVAQRIGDAFLLLQEASRGARRTIRRALAHPIYGLGPGEGSLTFEVRQDLASRGGLDGRSLRLL
jgi:hypothetical protein